MIIEFYCPICMELFENADFAYTTTCGHVFHQTCLTSWLGRSNTCPECRRICSTANIFKIYIKSRNSEKLSEVQKKLDEEIIKTIDMEEKLMLAQQDICQYIRDKEFSKIMTECLENEVNEKRLEIKQLREDLKSKEIQSIAEAQPTSDVQPTSAVQPAPGKICEKDGTSKCCESEELAKKDQIIKDLEKKLVEKSLELEKEIRSSTMMIVEKIKLQQQLIDAGISGAAQRGSNKTADTNKLNHQLRKSQHNANTSVTGAAAGGAETANVCTKKRLEKPIFDLFSYAKKLSHVGFQNVFFHEEKIFVRKNNADKIQIFSKAQVDALYRHFKSLSTNTPLASVIPKPTKCDDNYYAL